MRYTLTEIALVTNAEIVGSEQAVISEIFTDSRSFSAGEHLLFVALVGKNHDGHTYIPDLYTKHIRNFVVERIHDDFPKDCNYIVVENATKALQQIAAYHRSKLSFPIVGITGSNGKTIVKEWLNELLAEQFTIVRSPKSYNSQVGVPLSVLQIEENHNLGIFEAGISMRNEMQKLEPILLPDIGVLTNIGEAHQENFTTRTEKIKEKLKLFKNTKYLIFRSDYSEVENELPQNADSHHISWSSAKDGNVSIAKSEYSTTIQAFWQKQTHSFTIPFTDDASIENAVHCFFIIRALEEISGRELYSVKHFEKLQSVAMRLEMVHGVNASTLINDSYNSDLNSLRIALESLTQQNQHSTRTVILSDILQSGKNERQLYTEVSKLLENSEVDKLYGIGNKISAFKTLFKTEASFFETTYDFLRQIQPKDFQQEAILIKGARDFRFEKISNALSKKNHHTVLEINLNHLQHNLNYFRSLLKKETQIMVMVKAFSYGSGSYEIANWLQHQRIDYLGVAYADEGVELRKAGIDLPIMVMNVDTHNFDQILANNLEPELYNERIFNEFATRTEGYENQSVPVHIKLDTGMRRLGFDSFEIPQLLELLQNAPQLHVKSIFSHLAATDEPDLDSFTQEQVSKFQGVSDKVLDVLPNKPLLHILNSAGIERHIYAQFDMVRLGIGLYGISKNGENNTLPISCLKTYISQIKHIKKGESVGYSRKWIAQQDAVIGTLPIGYADCLDRRLGNRNGYVIINGKRAYFVGNICMDMCMIDITGLDAYEGEEVIVFGENPTIQTLAEQLGTIPYEVLTSVSPRVKRVYFQE